MSVFSLKAVGMISGKGAYGRRDVENRRGGAVVAKVCVIVIVHEGGAHLRRCVEALAGQTWQDFEAIIFDNASKHSSIHAIEPLPKGFRVIRSDRNLGFAAANNRAAAETSAPWIATLNPDAFPEPDWLAQLLDAAKRHGDVDMFGSTQLADATPGLLDGAGDVYHVSGICWRGLHGRSVALLPPEREVFAPCAAAALYRTSTFRAHGGFDERFFCFVEDIDLAFRIRLAGGRCIQVADAVVRHVGGGSVGQRSDFAVYYGTRNRLWTFVKNMPSPLFWPLVPVHVAANLASIAVVAMRGSGLPAWRGFWAALRNLAPVWRQRWVLQRQRISTKGIARIVVWSPLPLFKRGA